MINVVIGTYCGESAKCCYQHLWWKKCYMLLSVIIVAKVLNVVIGNHCGKSAKCLYQYLFVGLSLYFGKKVPESILGFFHHWRGIVQMLCS
jgi:hypothetical protein